MNISLSRSRLSIWSRETGSAVPSRVSLLISILRLSQALTCEILPEFHGGVHLFTASKASLYSTTGIIFSRVYKKNVLARVPRNETHWPVATVCNVSVR